MCTDNISILYENMWNSTSDSHIVASSTWNLGNDSEICDDSM